MIQEVQQGICIERRWRMKLAQIVVVFIIGACLISKTAAQTYGDASSAPSGTQRDVSTVIYLTTAMSIISFERQASELALTGSSESWLRTFAQRVVTESDWQKKMMEQSVAPLNLDVPRSPLLPQHQALLIRLSASGPDFDAVFRSSFLTVEQESFDLHSRYAGEGNTPELRAYANNTASLIFRRTADLKALVLSGTPGNAPRISPGVERPPASTALRNSPAGVAKPQPKIVPPSPSPQPSPPTPAPAPPRPVAQVASPGVTTSRGSAPAQSRVTDRLASGNQNGSSPTGNIPGSGGHVGLATGPIQIAGNIDDRDYPPAAMNERAQGTVLFRFIVRLDGHISDCAIERSSGNRRLDDITCRVALQRFRFRPALDAAGRPVSSQVHGEQIWQLGPIPGVPPR
jgi:protein TonB